ncbi:hypothetical protein [Nocardia nova]
MAWDQQCGDDARTVHAGAAALIGCEASRPVAKLRIERKEQQWVRSKE